MAAFLSGEAAPWMHVEQFGENRSQAPYRTHRTLRYVDDTALSFTQSELAFLFDVSIPCCNFAAPSWLALSFYGKSVVVAVEH